MKLNVDKQSKLMDIFERLLKNYGPLNWWPAETAFEVCIGAILTQNTAWINVEKAITELKRAGVLNSVNMFEISPAELGVLIRSSGFYNVKSRRIKAFVEWLHIHHNGCLDQMFSGEWPELRRKLIEINGIGRETCDCILLYAGNKPSFVVDNYTRRLFFRLGLISELDSYDEIREFFMQNLPKKVDLFNEYHALIVEHCKQYCRKKAFCHGCPLETVCIKNNC